MININEYEKKYGFIIKEDAIKKFEWIVNTLPEPWKTEFLEDILVWDYEYDWRTLNKCFMYYIDDCHNELPQETQDEIADKYIMISLR